MVLTVAALDVATLSPSLHRIVTDLVSEVFQDQALSLEHLCRELPQDMQGWLSVVMVRGISYKARLIWRRLEKGGRHPSG